MRNYERVIEALLRSAQNESLALVKRHAKTLAEDETLRKAIDVLSDKLSAAMAEMRTSAALENPPPSALQGSSTSVGAARRTDLLPKSASLQPFADKSKTDATLQPGQVPARPVSPQTEALPTTPVKSESEKPETLPPLHLNFKLPNASVGKAYDAQLKRSNDVEGTLSLRSMSGLDEVGGLAFNAEQGTLTGQPKHAGDFEFTLEGEAQHEDGWRQPVTGRGRLTVIPDPRSLWKNLPSDNTARFHKSDEATSTLSTTDGLRLLAASKRGRSHAHQGRHRDDDAAISHIKSSGWSILAVADGAGSCALSRRGSELAVTHGVRKLRDVLNGRDGEALERSYLLLQEDDNDQHRQALQGHLHKTIVTAAFAASSAIAEEAKENGDSPKAYSTTLLMAAHKQTQAGHLIVSFWVGDGAIALYRQGVALELLGEPDSGEYAGQTRFLDDTVFQDMSDLLKRRVSVKRVPDLTALLLATDGVTDPRFETEKQLMDLGCWDALWGEIGPIATQSDDLCAQENMLAWLDFSSLGNHDDRSIAVLCCPGGDSDE